MNRRGLDPSVVFATLLALVAAATMATLPWRGLLAHTAADDAFYYLAIARRAGEAPWPTFDGVHTTTGFHPLWLLVVVALAKVVASPWALVRVTIAVSSALMIAASLSFGRLFGRAWGGAAGVVAVTLLVASPGTARLGWMAMETPLSLLVLSLFLGALFTGRANAVRIGAWAGLLVLARLDMAIVVVVALAWRVLVERVVPLRAAAVVAVVASLAVAPYVAWNVALTGHVATTSSATKAYVAEDAAARDHGGRLNAGFAADVVHELARVGRDVARLSPASVLAGPIALAGGDHPSAVDPARHRGAIALLAALALAAGGLFAARGRRALEAPPAPAAGLLAVLAIASALHATIACTLLLGQSGPWYWGLEVVTIAAAASYASARWRGARVVARVACGATLASMTMMATALLVARETGRFDGRASFASVMLEAGAALDARREPGDVAGSCNAGTLGFFDPGVVNLDGLVNDWSLLEARRRGDVRGYLARENVRWIVDCVPAAQREGYARQLGLATGDIEPVAEIAGPACVGFVWHVAPSAALAARR